jgi:uncharacterized membrane protein YhiD involved in acid resistance
MSNIFADAISALQTVPGVVNQASGTVNRIEQRAEGIIEAAEVYAAASLGISALAAFSALALVILTARNSCNSGSRVFSNSPRTELRNPRKRKRRK